LLFRKPESMFRVIPDARSAAGVVTTPTDITGLTKQWFYVSCGYWTKDIDAPAAAKWNCANGYYAETLDYADYSKQTTWAQGLVGNPLTRRRSFLYVWIKLHCSKKGSITGRPEHTTKLMMLPSVDMRTVKMLRVSSPAPDAHPGIWTGSKSNKFWNSPCPPFEYTDRHGSLISWDDPDIADSVPKYARSTG
jgi:hypothetical protein